MWGAFRMRGPGIVATTVAALVGLIGLLAVVAVVVGFVTGWIMPYWQSIEEPQASLISGVATMYAAIFVATVVPVLFGGLIGELKRATNAAVDDLKAETDVALQDLREQFAGLATEFKTTVAKNREASDAIVSMVEESKQSLNTLMHYQLAQIGLKRTYTNVELANASNILKECHGTLEFICQSVLQQSKLRTNREKFTGAWVGYKPFIDALKQYGLVDDDRYRLMLKIADSRRHLKTEAVTITLVDLNLVAAATDDLKAWFESKRGSQIIAAISPSSGNAVTTPSAIEVALVEAELPK